MNQIHCIWERKANFKKLYFLNQNLELSSDNIIELEVSQQTLEGKVLKQIIFMQILFYTASKHDEEDRLFPPSQHDTPPLRKRSCHSVTSSIPSNDGWQCLSQRREKDFRQLSLVVQTETLYVMDGSRGQGKKILLEWKLGSSVDRQLTLHKILVAWPMLLLNPKCQCEGSKIAMQPQKVYDSPQISG